MMSHPFYINIHTHHARRSDECSVFSCYDLSETADLPSHTYLSYGLHPWYIPQDWEHHLSILEERWQHPHTLFIGECGLDAHSSHPLSLQETIFIRQAQWAKEHNLPLMIHCVKQIDRLIALHKQLSPEAPWVIHGFRGKPQQLKQLLRLGFHVSFGTHFHAESLALCPSDRFYIETDEATIAVRHLYHQIAQIRHIPIEQLQEEQQQNLNRLLQMHTHDT